ncbi:MAG: 30S ribosomal protein S20 [Chlamydiae bacterium]|nr:30S ribosomal protein S20 [Chlamydiota bacterium]
MADKKETKKTKRPTAEKRMIQNEKARVRNKAFKSRIRTAIRKFEESVNTGDKAQIEQSLSTVYSLIDKAVKLGIYKINKASRTKSRLMAKAAAKA